MAPQQPGLGGSGAGKKLSSLGGSCFHLGSSTAKKYLSMAACIREQQQGIYWGGVRAGSQALLMLLFSHPSLLNQPGCFTRSLLCLAQLLWREQS